MFETKKVSVGDHMDIHIMEDKNYKLSLRRGDGRDVHLFRVDVCLNQPDGIPYTVHVLAHDEDAACGQARCLKGMEEYRLGLEGKGTVKTEISRVPLMIEGWGKTLFE